MPTQPYLMRLIAIVLGEVGMTLDGHSIVVDHVIERDGQRLGKVPVRIRKLHLEVQVRASSVALTVTREARVTGDRDRLTPLYDVTGCDDRGMEG